MRKRTVSWPAFILCAALSLTAGVAHAGSVRCTDLHGAQHVLTHRPDAAFTFFVNCADAPQRATATPARARELGRLWQRQPAQVIWPAREGGAARLASAPADAGPRGNARLEVRAQAQWPVIQRVALDYDLNPHYLQAMMRVESAYQPQAVSPKGATGLMQIMPATARRFGVADPARELRDPQTNIETAARYLKFLQREFKDDWYLVTAAYNAGEGAVRKHGNAIPPYPETQNYVRSVEQHFDAMRRAPARP